MERPSDVAPEMLKSFTYQLQNATIHISNSQYDPSHIKLTKESFTYERHNTILLIGASQ